MNGGKQPRGYTIVEVLIVLAVSGLMFVAAANFISGKQARTSFTAGVNEMASNMQDVIQQVNDGRYSDVSLNCSNDGTTTNVTLGNGAGQFVSGVNKQCIFLGKLVYFDSIGGSTYQITPLAGGRLKDGNSVTNLTDAHPKNIVDLTEKAVTPQSLDVRDVKYTASGNPSLLDGYGFAITQSLGSTAGTGGSSGSAQLAYDPTLNAINGLVSDSLKPIDSVAICMTDGERLATISIDNKQGSLSVNTSMGSCS